MTLVELLVVLGVIGIILAISVPGMAGYARQLRLKTATRQTVGLLSLARSLAISSRTDHTVVVNPEQGVIQIVNEATGDTLEQTVRLPSSVTVELESGGEPSQELSLTFRPSGALTGRTVLLRLADRDRHHAVQVTGATGAVSVQ
ncbi:MAG: GspH/FimT family pseudopilin [Candidatus Omnitrophica bacterium]|nr:GspH/FimT family pseudopilin [Candidatus Omnitrophota bacterium]